MERMTVPPVRLRIFVSAIACLVSVCLFSACGGGGSQSSSSEKAQALLSATPTALDFGNVLVNQSSQRSVTVQNTGSSSVTISQSTLAGTGFAVSSLSLPLTLAGGKSVTFYVTFAPTATGTESGGITIASDATNSPTTISLDGAGVNSHSVSLSWVASTSSDVAGYNVYRSTVSGGPYAKENSALITVGSPLTYSDATVQAGETYYYVTTAVAADGSESAPSNQAEVIVPFP